MKFSERIGKTFKSDIIQTDSMDGALRNRLFNVVKDILDESYRESRGYLYINEAFLVSYCDTFGQKITEHDGRYNAFIQHLDYRIYIDEDVWFFYDFIEWLLSLRFSNSGYYAKTINKVLKEERSAYLLDDGNNLVKITDEIEVEEINNSLELARRFKGVDEHLSKAREAFSNRQNPDYKNCVRESIFAIESLLKIITDDKNATLETALKKIKNLNINLKESLIKLYHFRGDQGGVGHGNKNNQLSEITEYEAKLILVNAHSLVNYLIATFVTKN
jgi:hypothetical protein